jgi:hypothetical protein
MKPERWPDLVRTFVDRLGAQHEGLSVDVEYGDHIWTITASCPHCGTHVTWGVLGPEPRELVSAGIPEPAWYAKLADLPPGGTR